MRRISLFIVALFSVAIFVPQITHAACNPTTIEIDGTYEDWAQCPLLTSDTKGEDTNLQYWDVDTQAWTTTAPAYDTWTIDDAAMLDITRFKMLNDTENIYFYMKAGWPMMAAKAPDGAFYSMGELTAPEDFRDPAINEYDFVPSELPEFDHWMVWGFDKDLDGVMDYYFGAHLTLEGVQSEPGSEQSGPGLAVYKDDGDGEFDDAIDEKLADISTSDSNTSMDEGQNIESTEFEIRQNIETFYEETGISAGDTVKVRMETHSEIGDTTKAKLYRFKLASPKNLELEETTDGAELSWKNMKRATEYLVVLYNEDKEKIESYTTEENMYTLTDIEPGDYKVRVRAVREGGKGLWTKYKTFSVKEVIE